MVGCAHPALKKYRVSGFIKPRLRESKSLNSFLDSVIYYLKVNPRRPAADFSLLSAVHNGTPIN
jgi:hypothetical protein